MALFIPHRCPKCFESVTLIQPQHKAEKVILYLVQPTGIGQTQGHFSKNIFSLLGIVYPCLSPCSSMIRFACDS